MSGTAGTELYCRGWWRGACAAAAAAGQARSWLKASLHLVLLLLQVHPPTAAGLEAVRRHWLLPGELV
jgi:hypothetical protein